MALASAKDVLISFGEDLFISFGEDLQASLKVNPANRVWRRGSYQNIFVKIENYIPT